MSNWHVRNRYGFGAGRVILCPEPYRPPDASTSLAHDLREAGRDFAMASLPAMLAAVVVVGMLAIVGSIERDLGSDLEVVMMRSAPTPDPIAEIPIPVEPPSAPPVALAKVEEIPPPVVEPDPPPQIAQKPAPPEPVVVEAVVELAKQPPPPPKPAPVRPQIDRVQSAPELGIPEPTRRMRLPETIARRNVAPEPLSAPAAPMPSMPKPRPEPAARARRFAPVRAPEVSQKLRGVAKVAAVPMLGASADSPRRERARRVATASPQARTRTPAVDFARTPTLREPAAMSAPSPRSRVASSAPRTRRATPRPVLTSPGLIAPDPSLRESRTRTRHTPQAALVQPPGEARHARSGLAGVPLGSLAACVSEREEEALKRQLLAAVTTRETCSNSAGSYRFVETKNLNAFLMWVERASGRKAGDRCVELRHALACVAY